MLGTVLTVEHSSSWELLRLVLLSLFPFDRWQTIDLQGRIPKLPRVRAYKWQSWNLNPH